MAKAPKKRQAVAVEVAPMMGDPERERKYRAEDALRTLGDAEKIRKDKALMRDVDKARKAKMDELASIPCEVSEKTIGRKKA